MSKKEVTNDQGHIIDAIIEGNRHYVWGVVKFIGTAFIKCIDERFLIFTKTFDNFDPEKNNNFIYFYRQNLRYAKISNDDRSFSILTKNRNVINTLKTQASTPTEINPALIDDLKEWMNMGDDW